MITHAEYMADSANLHHAYYLEIAQDTANIGLPFTIQRIRQALDKGDIHLNSLPLTTWDASATIQQNSMRRALKRHGTGYSLGTGVCVLKAWAKHLAKLDATKEYHETYCEGK